MKFRLISDSKPLVFSQEIEANFTSVSAVLKFVLMKRLTILFFVVAVAVFLFKRVEFSSSQASAKDGNRISDSTVGPQTKNIKKNYLKTTYDSAPVSPVSTDKQEYKISADEVYCDLLNSGSNIPLGGTLKIWAISYENDEEGGPGFLAMIQSSNCPRSTYSKVRMDRNGRVREVIDCRDTTAEELVTRAGIQGNILVLKNDKNHLNFAISGEGMFVVNCGLSINYVRGGRFIVDLDGTLTTISGCKVLGEDAQALNVSDNPEFREDGCTNDGRCLAIVTPKLGDFVYQDRETLTATSDPFQKLVQNKSILVNSYEDLDNPESGASGPAFDRLPQFEKPKDCKF